jgi:hypothetical protein
VSGALSRIWFSIHDGAAMTAKSPWAMPALQPEENELCLAVMPASIACNA